jgi:flagellar FliL protein
LILNIVLMPVLAFATTNYLLIPKLKGTSASSSEHGSAATEEKGHGSSSSSEEKGGKEGHGGGKAKNVAPLSSKILVNLAGTLGTRYLLANITLVSNSPDLKGVVEKNDLQLRDVAASTLATKTIADLEKPGARNLIRTELISVFNSVLGNGVVQDIYLTEFAIQ